MARQPLFGATRMDSIRLGEAQATDVLVLDLEEVVAGKFVALLDRHAARDRFAGTDDIDVWIEVTVTLCRESFPFLFDLTANEQEFLNRLIDNDEIDARLLEVATEVQARISAMPMLAWKAQHVGRNRNISP